MAKSGTQEKGKIKGRTLKKAKIKRASRPGRSVKYDETFPLKAQDYARRGMIDMQIARKLGIARSTYYDYQKQFPEFSEAIKKGKMPVDIEVENALLKRAKGFEYEEVHVEYKPTGKEDEETKKRPTLIKKIKKFIVPDTAACAFWLKNRRPKLWKDRHDVDVSGNVNIKVVTAIPRSKKGKENG